MRRRGPYERGKNDSSNRRDIQSTQHSNHFYPTGPSNAAPLGAGLATTPFRESPKNSFGYGLNQQHCTLEASGSAAVARATTADRQHSLESEVDERLWQQKKLVLEKMNALDQVRPAGCDVYQGHFTRGRSLEGTFAGRSSGRQRSIQWYLPPTKRRGYAFETDGQDKTRQEANVHYVTYDSKAPADFKHGYDLMPTPSRIGEATPQEVWQQHELQLPYPREGAPSFSMVSVAPTASAPTISAPVMSAPMVSAPETSRGSPTATAIAPSTAKASAFSTASEPSKAHRIPYEAMQTAFSHEHYSQLATNILENFVSREPFVSGLPPPTILGSPKDRALLSGLGLQLSRVANETLLHLQSPEELVDVVNGNDEELSKLLPRKDRMSLAGMTAQQVTTHKRELNKIRARRCRFRKKRVESNLVQHTVDLSVYFSLLSNGPVMMAALSIDNRANNRINALFQRISSNWEKVGGIEDAHVLVEQRRSLDNAVHASCVAQLRQLLAAAMAENGEEQTGSFLFWRKPSLGTRPPPTQDSDSYVCLRCTLKSISIPIYANQQLLAIYAEPMPQ